MPKTPTRSWPFYSFVIAWVLIGVMLSGTIVDFLAPQLVASVYAEQSSLECEEDLADGWDAVWLPLGHRPLPAGLALFGASTCESKDPFRLSNRLLCSERGPPECPWA